MSDPRTRAHKQWIKPANRGCIVAVDVQCAASGPGHLDRVPCDIVITTLTDGLIYRSKPKVWHVFDPQTPITGMTEQEMMTGLPLEDALREVHDILALRRRKYGEVVLVGQGTSMDIVWLGLEQGVHYDRVQELSDMFCIRRGMKTYHRSLYQTAWALLPDGRRRVKPNAAHDPLFDCQLSLDLYICWSDKSAHELNSACQELNNLCMMRAIPEFVRYNGRSCQAGFSPPNCTCGQPTLVSQSLESMKANYEKAAKELRAEFGNEDAL